MYTISPEQIIGSYAVRYRTLAPMINTEYSGCGATTLNLFVDVADMLKTIARQPVDSPNPYSITSSIINLCAHYRNFFREYYQTHTRIFLITSILTTDLNRKFLPEYNKTVFGDNPMANSIIKDSIDMLNLLVPYIEDIHFCITNYEFGVYVYDIIAYDLKEHNFSCPGIVITKDIYNYQLVSDDESMVRILRPKKEGKDDTSYIINDKTAIYYYCKNRRVEYINNNINSSLLSFIFAMTRLPERNLKSIHQIPATIKALNQVVESGIVMNQRTTAIDYLCEQMVKNTNIKIRDPFLIFQRFRAIDIESQYLAYCADSFMKYSGIKNLHDPVTVKEISMKYFKDCPLDLNVL